MAGIDDLQNLTEARQRSMWVCRETWLRSRARYRLTGVMKVFLTFDAKTALIKHYQQSLGVMHFRGQRMFIETSGALRLISQYFKT